MLFKAHLTSHSRMFGSRRVEPPLLGNSPPSHIRAPVYPSSLCCMFCSVASVMTDSATQGTVAHQAPLSMEFSRKEYWSGLPCASSRGCSQATDPTHVSCVSCIAGGFFTSEPLGNFIAHIQSLTMSTKRMLFLLSHVAIAVLSSMTETMTVAFYPSLCSLTFPAPIHPLSIIHLTDNGKYDHKACHIKYLSGSPCK